MPENELTEVVRYRSSSHSGAWVRDTLLIFGTAILVFSIGLPQEFIGLDARYALFAKEMLRNGLSFFPTTFSSPYPDYPATTVLPIVWLSGINGAVTPLTAILPTAVVSGGILVFTYLIGSLLSRTWGLCAVCMSFLTLAFLRAARSVSPDQWTSFATVASFYLAHSAHVQGHRRRLWFVPALFVLGFAARGPIGLIIPASAVLTLVVCARQYKAAVLWALVAVSLLAVCFGALLAAANYQDGKDFAQRVWAMQVSGRLAGGGRGPEYYWLTAWGSYAFSYPIAVVATVGLWPKMARRDSAEARQLFALAMCAVVVLTGMSIPTEKKTRYVLSIVPFIALLAAYSVALPDSQAVLSRLRKALTAGGLTLPWIAGPACVLRALLAAFGAIPGEIHVLRAAICTILAAALAFDVSVRSSYATAKSVYVIAACAVSLVILEVGVIEPTIWAREESRVFSQQVEERCVSSDKPIVFLRLGPDQEDIVLAANMGEPFQPRFIESFANLDRVPSLTCIIAAEQDILELAAARPHQVRTLEVGTLGGKRVALCRMTENSP